MNKSPEPLEQKIAFLKENNWDAYMLFCAVSVYRNSVLEDYWFGHLVVYLRRFFNEECDKQRQSKAKEELIKLDLVEETRNHNGRKVLTLLPSVRTIAIAERKKLLSALKEAENIRKK